MTWTIVNPRELGAPRGWNNGMLAPGGGRVLFVAGQIGVAEDEGADARAGAPAPPSRTEESSPSASAAREEVAAVRFAAQFGEALARVAAVVRAAGGSVTDIGRLTIYVTDMDAYRGSLRETGAAYREVFGRHFPAMALVAVTELVEPRAVVEVEATAVLPEPRRKASSPAGEPIAKEHP